MRVAVLHPSLKSFGGAARVCLNFVHVLCNAGYEVTLFTVDKVNWKLLGKVFGDLPDVNFRERFLFSRFPRFFSAGIQRFIIALFYFIEVLVVRFFSDYDLVLVTSGELIDFLGDIIYVNAIPFRLTHLFSGAYLGVSPAWKCYSKLYDSLLRIIGKIDSRGLLLANSRFIKNVLRRFIGRDSLILHPPVNVKRLMNLNGYLKERCDLVITVSRFHPGKSLGVILNVAELIDKARFLIVGSSGKRLEENIRKLETSIETRGLEDKVSLLVDVPFIKLFEALSKAKIFLHTQPSEAFGMAVVEAMAAGCVPVVPRSGGPWIDILGGMQGAYGFSYRDIKEAAEIIKKLLDDDGLRREIATRARARALVFDKAVFEKRILEIVEKIYREKFG